jgi:hypothetical protein
VDRPKNRKKNHKKQQVKSRENERKQYMNIETIHCEIISSEPKTIKNFTQCEVLIITKNHNLLNINNEKKIINSIINNKNEEKRKAKRQKDVK